MASFKIHAKLELLVANLQNKSSVQQREAYGIAIWKLAAVMATSQKLTWLWDCCDGGEDHCLEGAVPLVLSISYEWACTIGVPE